MSHPAQIYLHLQQLDIRLPKGNKFKHNYWVRQLRWRCLQQAITQKHCNCCPHTPAQKTTENPSLHPCYIQKRIHQFPCISPSLQNYTKWIILATRFSQTIHETDKTKHERDKKFRGKNITLWYLKLCQYLHQTPLPGMPHLPTCNPYTHKPAQCPSSLTHFATSTQIPIPHAAKLEFAHIPICSHRQKRKKLTFKSWDYNSPNHSTKTLRVHTRRGKGGKQPKDLVYGYQQIGSRLKESRTKEQKGNGKNPYTKRQAPTRSTVIVRGL